MMLRLSTPADGVRLVDLGPAEAVRSGLAHDGGRLVRPEPDPDPKHTPERLAQLAAAQRRLRARRKAAEA